MHLANTARPASIAVDSLVEAKTNNEELEAII